MGKNNYPPRTYLKAGSLAVSYCSERPLLYALLYSIIVVIDIILTTLGICWVRHLFKKLVKKDFTPNENGIDKSAFSPQEAMTLSDIKDKAERSGGLQPMGNGLFNFGDIVFLYGESGKGKSVLVAQLLYKWSRGETSGILPDETAMPPIKALLIDSEQKEEDYLDRYGKRLGKENSFMTVLIGSQYQDWKDCITKIQKNIADWKDDSVLAVDNLTSSFPIQNNDEIRAFIGEISQLQKSYFERTSHKITVILVGHTRKDKTNFFGGGNLSNLATLVLQLKEANNGSQPHDKNERILAVEKSRRTKYNNEEIPIKLVGESGDDWLHFERLAPQCEYKRKDRRYDSGLTDEQDYKIYLEHERGKTLDQLAKEYNRSVKSIRKAVARGRKIKH